jgi:hypothetical protein
LARLGKPGLIHLAWGEKGEAVGAREPWYRRAGIRDAKRAIVIGVILCYGTGLSIALSMRKPVFVQIEADRSVLFTKDASGATINKFRVIVGNRTSRKASVKLELQGLDQAHIVGPATIEVDPGQTSEQLTGIAVPAGILTPAYVTHFQIRALTQPGGDVHSIDTTFIMPRPEREK